ncbi:uncharacterized protein LOC127764552 [Oryza glaberrima]|uniref:uncharacterized protein LOC127764552 n=1 Tax=Oryza glaberrima TaxID=4538 RepID=UPI00224C62CD|nr:uncharacterized protein LOC127764552 [Oryza glaberrima]
MASSTRVPRIGIRKTRRSTRSATHKDPSQGPSSRSSPAAAAPGAADKPSRNDPEDTAGDKPSHEPTPGGGRAASTGSADGARAGDRAGDGADLGSARGPEGGDCWEPEGGAHRSADQPSSLPKGPKDEQSCRPGGGPLRGSSRLPGSEEVVEEIPRYRRALPTTNYVSPLQAHWFQGRRANTRPGKLALTTPQTTPTP